MNLIDALLNVFTGHNAQEATLLEIRGRAHGLLLSGISRLERISDSELVMYYQNGRLNGTARIKSTRQTLDRYENALCARFPRIVLRKGSDVLAAKRTLTEIELDSVLN